MRYFIVDKNVKGPYGVAPLHLAARNNCVEAVKMLIQQGASVDVREAKQKTPLHVAARRGNIPVIKVRIHNRKSNIDTSFSFVLFLGYCLIYAKSLANS